MSLLSSLSKRRNGIPQFKLDRLKAEWHTTQERLEAVKTRVPAQAGAWWAAAAERSLANAESALGRCDLDGGWGGVHDAQRYLVFGMNDGELLAQAASLREETQSKLQGWRARATEGLLADPASLAVASGGLVPERRERLQHSVVEALAVLHGHSDNVYHQLRLVGRQLNYLVVICVLVLWVVFVASLQYAAPDSALAITALLPVALAGALGGIISAMYQLSRVGQSRIPEAWLQGLVTSGRPLVGAASALFIYVVLQSDLIQLVDSTKVGFPAALVLAFVAGFSEQFVLGTVAKVAGGGSRTEVTNKTLVVTDGGGNAPFLAVSSRTVAAAARTPVAAPKKTPRKRA